MNEFETNISLCIWTYKEIKSFAKMLFEDELDDEEYSMVKWVCLTLKKNIACCVITDNCKKKEYEDIIIHEIVHWVHYIIDYLWHPTNYDWTELFAYYMSYYIKKWIEFIKKINKK